MSADAQVVIHLFTLKCGPPLDKKPSREEIKLAEWMASTLKDFEARQLEVDRDVVVKKPHRNVDFRTGEGNSQEKEVHRIGHDKRFPLRDHRCPSLVAVHCTACDGRRTGVYLPSEIVIMSILYDNVDELKESFDDLLLDSDLEAPDSMECDDMAPGT
ncbi:unnamed protein product [Heligmosomoides polygyrus]|uniref:Uncharacterized protein n=1 Tax=Heligmosomoides polygyrus TaxID=6339 RepID=A0A183FU25_HELPZ|nr:unnamed protein product [Heligmosomoides polygyrus]